jgi:UDP-perosamine 4-acetyltransferase
VVLGGGGHAAVVIEALWLQASLRPSAVLDNDARRWGRHIGPVPISGGDDLIPALMRDGVSSFIVGLGGSSDNAPRARLFDLGRRYGLEPLTICHPAAVCSPSITIGKGSVVLALAVVNAGAVVGEDVIINTGVIVEHHCIVESHVHLATGSTLCGGVRVGEGAHIGAGAVVRQGMVIGARAVVGAGAVVVDDVPPDTTVVGLPARPMPRRP